MIQSLRLLIIVAVLALLLGCQAQSHPTLKVAPTSIPHAEILEVIKPDLKAQNIDLEIIVVEDYNTPNRALNDKEVDANFFQHLPFLEAQINDFGYQLESYGAIHIEPMALYSKKIQHLNQLSAGAIIAVPSDPSNQARALCLLQESGLIKMTRCDSKASVLDIQENPKQLKIVEIDSPLLSRALEDVELAAITTNFALQAGLSPQRDALAIEGSQSLFSNILVIRANEADRSDLQALKTALRSEKVKQFIHERYKGAVIPTF